MKMILMVLLFGVLSLACASDDAYEHSNMNTMHEMMAPENQPYQDGNLPIPDPMLEIINSDKDNTNIGQHP